MENAKSLEIISQMIKENRKSLHRNSFYFILWGGLLVPAGIIEYLLVGNPNFWMIWPAIGIVGGIISAIYGKKEGQRAGAQTAGDRITGYTWGGFLCALLFVIVYAVMNHLPPHPLILLLAGLATFISGGISKFNPFIYGSIALFIGALVCGFFIDPVYQGLVFSVSILLGYVIPGVMLRNMENEQA